VGKPAQMILPTLLCQEEKFQGCCQDIAKTSGIALIRQLGQGSEQTIRVD
jgi:hypothetical protein